MHICVGKLTIIGNIVNWILRNKLQWNFIWNLHISIQENSFENICEMEAIFFSAWMWVNLIQLFGSKSIYCITIYDAKSWYILTFKQFSISVSNCRGKECMHLNFPLYLFYQQNGEQSHENKGLFTIIIEFFYLKKTALKLLDIDACMKYWFCIATIYANISIRGNI